MAKPPNGTTGEVNGAKSEEAEAEADARWGTWEELLLACAVNRYGTNCWDSVAVEIKKRSSSTTPPLLLTPRNCQKKYLDLTRRFFLKNDRRNDNNNGVNSKNDGVQAADDDGSIITTDESVPLLEELRKLRVAELRRELERYDLSIVTLQSKVKKMKEERERSEIRDEKSSDPLSERDSGEVNREDIKDEPEKSPLSVAGEVAVSPVIGKDEQSVNDSSTDRRSEDIGTGRNEEEKMEESGRTGDRNVEPVRTVEDKPVKEEDSCYGSSDSVEKEDPEPEPDPKPVRNEVKVEPESVSDSPELVESVAESKDGGGGEDATNKECSDVQSSATQSRREAGTDKVLRGSSNDNDHKNKSGSQTVKLEPSVESQPLIDFLENVKGHELGSLFLRRLDSQEAPNYKSLIRQHVDLEIVEKKVKEVRIPKSFLLQWSFGILLQLRWLWEMPS
ncbi:hypothetical protein ACH5RR_002650 [Cinchona calisaya]|uniref:Bromo domain-containing protein n=1 Tax=Cinchona calisaya TaxID=153742 RepID=A0ABD3ASQ9_9GENT